MYLSLMGNDPNNSVKLGGKTQKSGQVHRNQ